MPHRLVESSSDIIVEAEAPDLGSTLVAIAQGFTDITTAGSTVTDAVEERIHVHVDRDLPALAVAFVNELIFLFATKSFLPAGGDLDVAKKKGRWHAEGTLTGDRFDPQRHGAGTEVKAATLHDAVLERGPKGARASVLLDL